MKSVITKVTALVLSGIILSTIAIGGASILNSRRAVLEDSTQMMKLQCANQTGEINALFARIEQSVETLKVYAANQLKDTKRFQTDAAYVAEYSQSLLAVAVNAAENTEGAMTVYIRYNPEFTDPQSGIFCQKSSSNGTFQPLTPTNITNYDPSDRVHVGWFYEPAQKKTGTWLAPYFNENIQVDMISYTVPFYQNNIFIGVVGMDIDFTVLEEVVGDTSVYETGYSFLTDEQAKIVYHKDLSRGTSLTEYNQGEFRQMAEMLKTDTASGSALIAYTYQGVKKQAAFQSLQNGMRLVVSAPDSEINFQANLLIGQIAGASLLIIAAGAIWTVIYTRRLAKPLLELTVAAKKIADGDLSVTITHISDDEVGDLAESFRQTVAHLHKYISYINELAYRDSLTGVKNKTAYLEVVNRMDDLTRLKRPQYAVVVFDINGLKLVNDTRGHDYGDLLIVKASKLICGVFKRSPIYRIGGDEFVALLENADFEGYSELLEEFRQKLEAAQDGQEDLTLSVARGIAVFSEETDLTYHDVFKRADSAMYRNKQEMKNRAGMISRS